MLMTMAASTDQIELNRARATGRLAGTVTEILWSLDSRKEYPAILTEADLAALRQAIVDYDRTTAEATKAFLGYSLPASPIQIQL